MIRCNSGRLALAVAIGFGAAIAAGCSSRHDSGLTGSWGQTVGETDEDGGTSISIHFLPNGTMTQDIVSMKESIHLELRYTAKAGKLTETPLRGTKDGHPMKLRSGSATFPYAVSDDRLLIGDPVHHSTMDLRRLSQN